MFSIPYLSICIYCILQLIVLLIQDNRRLKEHSIREYYFSIMLVIAMFSFLATIVSSMNHIEGVFPLAATGNYIEIILNTILIPVYFSYVCTQINDINVVIQKRVGRLLQGLAALCILIVVSTRFTGAVFYFDEAQNYHRGPLFFVPMSILFIMLVIIGSFTINQRLKIEISYFKSLMAFLLLPLIGWTLQVLIFGLPFSLMSVTFAAQVIYNNVQNKNMNMDYLTGVYNRQALDSYLQKKINTTTKEHGFSAAMIDINNFKMINDTFGHYEGDSALIRATEILRASVGHKDLIARYGGDEFCIIFNEGSLVYAEDRIGKINQNLKDFNHKIKKPYQFSFSIGYDSYDPQMGNDIGEFLKLLDKKMYEDKKVQKDSH